MGLVASLFRKTAGPTFRGGSLSSSTWLPVGIGSMGGPTNAGVDVNEQSAMAITAVYRSVALISEAVSMLPLNVLQKVGDRREDRSDHPIAKLLRKPNDLMNAVDFRASIQSHALQYGDGYIDVQRTQRDEPVALWPLLPDRTGIASVMESGSERRVVYVTTVDGNQVKIDPMDVAHVRGLSFDGLRGYSPLRLARQGLGLALALEEFGAKFFGNDAKSGGFITHPSNLSAEAQKRLQDSSSAQGGLSNAHRLKILEEGMKFEATTIAPEDAQFLMTRTFQVEEIARLYGIPLHMLQSQAKSTSWGSGIAQMSLGFLIYTLAPWLTRWEQELTRKLFTQQEIDAGYFIKHNVNALLRADPASRASFYTAALSSSTGWMSRDEVRALEDLNPDGIENEMGGPLPAVSQIDTQQEPDEEDEDDEE